VKRDKKLSKSRGITLVALIITIILMLILVGVSIQVAINSDLIGTAEDAAQRTENAYISESTTGSLTIGDTEYSSIEEYLELLEYEQNMPEFVETIEDCKDTSKKYVLPDGYLYEYVPQKMATFTNLFDKDADGYIVDSYINGSAEVATKAGSIVTNYIQVQKGQTIHIKGIATSVNGGTSYCRIQAYDSNKTRLTTGQLPTNAIEHFITASYDESVATWTLFNLDSNKQFGSSDSIVYIRIGGALSGTVDDVIITLDETIEYDYGSYAWQKTEQYIPADWFNEIEITSSTVKNLKTNAGSNAIQFILTSDLHYDSVNYHKIKNVGKVSNLVMKDCSIPFFMNLGDSTNLYASYGATIYQSNVEKIVDDVFAPINKMNILMTVGNHDGAAGVKEVDGETLTYRHQLNNEERANIFFGWQRANLNKKFGPDGTYYYIDDKTTKTRYIMLNSFWTEWDGEEDGFTTDINHSFFHKPLFGQEQLTWFAEEALNMPEGYSAIIGTHSLDSQSDIEVFKGILSAYKNKTIYTGSYTGTEEWQSSSISVDYSNAKGELIATFHGHQHKDQIDTTNYIIPYIGITASGGEPRDEDAPTRTVGTSTETAIDVVTIDKTNKKIYMTRLGVGSDRVIEY